MTRPDWLEPTLKLQNCDVEIRASTQRLNLIPGEIEQQNQAAAESHAQLSQAREQLKTLEVKLKQLELDVGKQEHSIQDLLTKSALIKKQDDYNAAMEQIKFANERRSELETEELLTMDAIETAQKEVRALEIDDKEYQENAASEIAELRAHHTEIEAHIAKLNAQRDELKKAVPAEILSLYERLWARNRGIPLNPIMEGICQNCHTKVTQQVLNDLQRGGMVSCSNCGALVYAPNA